MLARFLLLVSLCIVVSQAKEYKAVFDCSSGNASYIKSRMWLVGKTMDMFEERGDTIKVALTLHGKCVPMVSEAFDEVVQKEDMTQIKEAQEHLKALSKRKNVEIVACSMSLQSNEIDEDDVLPFVKISDNSFLDTIGYQNDGYALMTFQ